MHNPNKISKNKQNNTHSMYSPKYNLQHFQKINQKINKHHQFDKQEQQLSLENGYQNQYQYQRQCQDQNLHRGKANTYHHNQAKLQKRYSQNDVSNNKSSNNNLKEKSALIKESLALIRRSSYSGQQQHQSQQQDNNQIQNYYHRHLMPYNKIKIKQYIHQNQNQQEYKIHKNQLDAHSQMKYSIDLSKMVQEDNRINQDINGFLLGSGNYSHNTNLKANANTNNEINQNQYINKKFNKPKQKRSKDIHHQQSYNHQQHKSKKSQYTKNQENLNVNTFGSKNKTQKCKKKSRGYQNQERKSGFYTPQHYQNYNFEAKEIISEVEIARKENPEKEKDNNFNANQEKKKIKAYSKFSQKPSSTFSKISGFDPAANLLRNSYQQALGPYNDQNRMKTEVTHSTNLIPHHLMKQSLQKIASSKKIQTPLYQQDVLCGLSRIYQKSPQELKLKLMKMKARIITLEGTVKNFQALNKELIKQSDQHGLRLDQFANNTRNTIKQKEGKIADLQKDKLKLQALLHSKEQIILSMKKTQSQLKVNLKQLKQSDNIKKSQIKGFQTKLKSKIETIQFYEEIIKDKQNTIKKMSDFNNELCLKFYGYSNKAPIIEQNSQQIISKNLTIQYEKIKSQLSLKQNQISKLLLKIKQLQSTTPPPQKNEQDIQNQQINKLVLQMQDIINSQRDIIQECSDQILELKRRLSEYQKQKANNNYNQLSKASYHQNSFSNINAESNASYVNLQIESKYNNNHNCSVNPTDNSCPDRLNLCDQSQIYYKIIEQKEKIIKDQNQIIHELKGSVQFWKIEYEQIHNTLKSIGIDKIKTKKLENNYAEIHSLLSIKNKSSASSLTSMKSMASLEEIGRCGALLQHIEQKQQVINKIKNRGFQKKKEFNLQKTNSTQVIRFEDKFHQYRNIESRSRQRQRQSNNNNIHNNHNSNSSSKGVNKEQGKSNSKISLFEEFNALSGFMISQVKNQNIDECIQENKNKVHDTHQYQHEQPNTKEELSNNSELDLGQMRSKTDSQIKGSKCAENMTFGDLQGQSNSKLPKIWSFSSIKPKNSPNNFLLKLNENISQEKRYENQEQNNNLKQIKSQIIKNSSKARLFQQNNKINLNLNNKNFENLKNGQKLIEVSGSSREEYSQEDQFDIIEG